jgi:hypothetical protein
MENFFGKIFKKFILSILSFYFLMIMFLTFIPDHKDVFTLVSTMTTICTLSLSFVFSVLVFSLDELLDSILRTFFFGGMLVTYCFYLYNEFPIISLHFNFISLAFDLFTSGISFLAIKEFFKGCDHGK